MDMMLAEMAGRARALRDLLETVHGTFLIYTIEKGLTAKIKRIMGNADDSIESGFECEVGNIKYQTTQKWPERMMVKVRASVSRTDLIKNYVDHLQKNVKMKKISEKDASEILPLLQAVFAEAEYFGEAYGISTNCKDQAIQKFSGQTTFSRLDAQQEVLYFYQEKALKLLPSLGSFFILEETATHTKYAMRVFGIQCKLPEPDFSKLEVCPVEATWTREAFIASLSICLKEAKKSALTKEELAELQKLPESKTIVIQE
ncbi:MAG: hypothetical protein AABZ60_15435, partial [Planctomycetota bacterium]